MWQWRQKWYKSGVFVISEIAKRLFLVTDDIFDAYNI